MRFGANSFDSSPIGSHTADHGGGDDDGNGGVFDGSGGSVHLEGTDGVDTFVIPTAADSTGINFDTIERFDAAGGDVFNLPNAVTGIDASVTTGSLSTATFDSDLASDLSATQLAADHAVLFTASAGDFHGETFLVIDGNDTAGYQAGQDFVIRVDDSSPITGLTTANFTTGTPPPFTGDDDDDQGDDHGNHMNGGSGDDHMDGNGGNDNMSGGGGDDSLNGGTGNDKMNGGDGDDDITGATGNDRMSGGAGNDVMNGDNGDDHMSGGAGHDTMNGGGGADNMNGGGGADTFVFDAVSDSTSTTFDTIHGFDPHHGDNFDLPFAVTGVDAAINHGSLSLATFDADLSAAVGAGQLAAGHAVLFTASEGTLRHDTFLVIDANGVAGYQAGQDLVIHLDNPNHIASLSTASFI
jgi:Ca2+-binding RTX toxin-like protein